jgi:hypothetical protein
MITAGLHPFLGDDRPLENRLVARLIDRNHTMESLSLARRVAAVAGGAAIVAMVAVTASCAKEEKKAPETTTTTTTTTTSAAPTEKSINPTGGNLFTPTVYAPPAPTEPPGVHRNNG